MDVSAIEKKTPQERIDLISHWSMWFYENTESWHGELGMEIAYLQMAVAMGKRIELGRSSALVRTLIDLSAHDPEPGIWEYIDLTSDDVAGGLLNDEDEDT